MLFYVVLFVVAAVLSYKLGWKTTVALAAMVVFFHSWPMGVICLSLAIYAGYHASVHGLPQWKPQTQEVESG